MLFIFVICVIHRFQKPYRIVDIFLLTEYCNRKSDLPCGFKFMRILTQILKTTDIDAVLTSLCLTADTCADSTLEYKSTCQPLSSSAPEFWSNSTGHSHFSAFVNSCLSCLQLWHLNKTQQQDDLFTSCLNVLNPDPIKGSLTPWHYASNPTNPPLLWDAPESDSV